jgi:hypothetical protein
VLISAVEVAMDAMLNTLTQAELLIVRSAEPSALADLDEDALLDVHDRVRRARKKYLGQYRRQASAKVSDVGGRGKAYAQNQRARDKAEVFETALARVSTALAKAARRSAAELKAERLSAVRSEASTPARPRARVSAQASDTSTARRPPRKSTGRVKRDAGDIAVGRRKQVRKDSK